MACLVQKELVDFEHPEDSLVLSWIERADPASALITQEIIDEEYAAVREWIEYSAECQSSACAGVVCADEEEEQPFCPVGREPAAGTTPAMFDEGGCSDKDLEQLFRDTFYAARGRCFPCHFDDQPSAPENAPRWISTQLSCENAALETMMNVVEAGYLNLDDPDQSLIILKPLDEDLGGVEHEGHDKITKDGDRVYEYLIYWIQRYADCHPELRDAGAGQPGGQR